MMLTKKQYVEKLNWGDIVYADKLEDWISQAFCDTLWFFNTGELDYSMQRLDYEKEVLLDEMK